MSQHKIIITEKPSVARDIARVLNADKRQEGFLEGNGYKITWAIGHLITLNAPEEYDEMYKKWELETLPIIPETFKKDVIQDTGVRRQFHAIKTLLQSTDAEEVICATDAGREGELIFRYIYDHSECTLPIKRLWISSQTDQAIKDGFASLRDGKDYNPLYDSAVSRSEADWLIGMNATRAYTIKCSRGAGVMSVGRVQTPVLKMIVDRYEENSNFTPETFYEIKGEFEHENGIYTGKWTHDKETRFKSEEDVDELITDLKTHETGRIDSVKHNEKKEKPPLLYDLTELQKEAHRKFKYSAEDTLKIMQDLYEKHKLITYPRTSSRYLSKDLVPKLKERIENTSEIDSYKEIAQEILASKISPGKRVVDDKKVTDHHAIIPTEKKANLGQLSPAELNIYHLILKRFLCVFLPDCVKAQTEILTAVGSHSFRTSGTVITKAGWRSVYGQDENTDDDEGLLPNVTEKDSVKICEITKEEGQTKAPPLHNEASILSAMETAGKNIEDDELRQAMKDCGLGTPATRASILERLIKVNYISREKNKLVPTAKGIQLISLIQSDELLSPEMTGEWEKKLNEMAKGSYKRDSYMNEIKSLTQDIVQKVLDTDLSVVGKDQNLIGKCPACEGNVVETKLSFSCSNWQQRGCKFAVWKSIAGKNITEKHAKALLKEGKTDVIKGFKNKEGKRFDAALIIKGNDVSFSFATKTLGDCPMEGCEGEIIETPKAYSCSNWRQTGCKFAIWKQIAGKQIEDEIAKTLLDGGKTEVLKGFKSRQGNPFDAALELKEGKVQFIFSN